MFELVAGALLETLLGEAVGLLAERAKQANLSRDEKKRIQRIGRDVAEGMQQHFEHEIAGWADNDLEAVGAEAALALTRVPLTAAALINDNLDPLLLAQRLRAGHAPTGFSPDQRAVYEWLLRGISEAVMRVAKEVKGYEEIRDKVLLTGQDDLRRGQAATTQAIDELASREEREAAATEERYRRAVKRLLDRMELFGVDKLDRAGQSHQSLTVSFITLRVEGEQEETAEEARARWHEQGHLPDDGLAHRRPVRRSGPADEMLARMKRAVIVGKAGSGKSTLLRWLAVRAASADCPTVLNEWNRLVPFFIRLREHVERGFPPPGEFPTLVARELHFPDGWAERLLETGRVLVLIDGVDEVPADKREAMLEAIDRLVQSYPDARYLLSARPTALKEWQAWQEWVTLANVQEVALQEMDMGQIEAFVDHWFRAVAAIATLLDAERARLPALPAPLKFQLRQRPLLRQLATTPLLCAMLCALYRERQQELPAERITLYQRCCEMLLWGREDKAGIKAGPEYPNLSDTQRWSLLRAFAAWLLRNGWTEVATEQATEQFDLHLKRFGWPGTGEGARAYFVERTGLLTEPIESRAGKEGTIAFTHRTFQDFLAAHQLQEDESQGELLAHATEDGWRETIILAAGLGSTRWREGLVGKLLEQASAAPDADLRRHLHLLALACLETARVAGVEMALQTRVLDAAKAYFPPRDMAEAELLAKVGETAIPFLAPTAEQSDKGAAACVRALALIGGPAAMQALVPYAEKSNETNLQWAFYGLEATLLTELGQSWDAFDRDQYLRVVLMRCKALRCSTLLDLRPLQALTNLEVLNLSQSGVSDLRPLHALTNLRALDLSQSGVSDLRPLQALAELTWLALSASRVSDLRPLQALTSLRTLNLSQSGVNDLTPLQALTKLERLYLSQSGVSDLRPLQALTNLEALNLSQSGVSDLRPLEALTNLRTLDLSRTEVSDLTPLQALTKLRELYLSESGVSDLRPLQALTNLQRLYLSREQLRLVPEELRDKVRIVEGDD